MLKIRYDVLAVLLVPIVSIIATLAIVISDTRNNTQRIDDIEKSMMGREVIELKIKQGCSNG